MIIAERHCAEEAIAAGRKKEEKNKYIDKQTVVEPHSQMRRS